MAARHSRSKKQSAGKAPSPSPPEELSFIWTRISATPGQFRTPLTKVSVRLERHLAHFQSGTPDETWLPKVGANGWVLLTADKRIRYNFLEKQALKEYAVREFVFASGNMSGQDMASALELALPKMQRLCRKVKPPFVGAITRT